MSDDAGGPNILHLYLTEPSGVCVINGDKIPHQTVTLKSYKMMWSTPGVPDVIPFITFKASFMSSESFVNGKTTTDTDYNIDNKGLVLETGYEPQQCDIDLELSNDLPVRFNYQITTTQPDKLEFLKGLDLVFNYNKTG